MRFDNAFKTSRGNVGMQFTEYNKATKQVVTFTVYRDEKGVLQCTEEASAEQKIKMLAEFNRREKWYSQRAAH
jgi:hypothetical protein